MLTSASEAVRDADEVIRAVDEKRTGQQGLEALRASLTHVERVQWLLGDLRDRIGANAFYLWLDDWLTEEIGAMDALERIAELAKGVDPVAAQLVRWTMEVARRLRAGEDLPRASDAVGCVWAARREEQRAFVRAVVERWPADVDPFALPDPGPLERRITAPQQGHPRYPASSWTVARQGGALPRLPEGIEPALDAIAFSLWQIGASTGEIARFIEEVTDAEQAVGEVMLRWVRIVGDEDEPLSPAALRARLFPPSPLEQFLQVGGLELGVLALLQTDLDDAEEALQDANAMRLTPREDGGLVPGLRGALRMGLDVLIVDAAHLTDEAVPLLAQAAATGHAVLVAGSSPLLSALIEEAKSAGTPVVTQGAREA